MSGALDVEAWYVDTTVPVLGGDTLLGAAERARSRRFAVAADAPPARHAAGAARASPARRAGRAPADVRGEVGPHGKPGPVVGQRWNLSRSGGHALVALAADDVGVDVQVRDPRVDVARGPARSLARAPGPAGAAAAGRRLARLEACAKAVGGRLLDVLGLDVTTPGVVRADDGAWRGQEWWVSDVPAPDGAVAACATPGARPHVCRVRTWPGEQRDRPVRVPRPVAAGEGAR